ncbi:membrane-spanning 4-domains subfamily A member 6D-like [Sciurus carolinensis]|uniref:membrane-spanning 4-domains subfamily A member 6D-like n=1 Tax=Sciurus carolinensis TaxID=30640 RepID=UPI001FB4B71B|nr:membrane-spanning 4-domains subfamily A member 6D-like [Sciurus carolinensis]
MISQPGPSGSVTVLTANGMNFPQTENTRPTHHKQDDLKKLLKGEVKVIGTVQIMCGLMVLSLGIILASAPFSPHFTSVFSILLRSGYPFIGSLCFVICGSLSIVIEKKSTKPLVSSNLVMSILSTLCGLVGFILISVNLHALGPASQQCELDQQSQPTVHYGFYYHYGGDASRDCYMAKASLTGVLSVMLIGTMLESCLAVLMVVLWWKQAHSDYSGSVLFLPQSDKNKSNMSSNVICNPGYEKLSTS